MKYITMTALVLSLGLFGCEPQGPMEEAGEEIDEMAKDAGNKIEDTCENIKDAVDAKKKNC